MSERCLIVNADDFGRSEGINRGVAIAHERGIVTSSSLMVGQAAAESAVALARSMPRLSLGLHVDLAEFAYRDGEWVSIYELVGDDRALVAAECRRQLARFRTLVGRDPSHLDSHQHVHRHEPIRAVLVELATELGVPLREQTRQIRYRGDYYGHSTRQESVPEALSVDALAAVVRSLAPGTSELGCHPAFAVDFDSSYAAERLLELKTLCSDRIRDVLERENIRLVSFDELGSG